MQDKYIEYSSYPDIESAIEMTDLLESNNIDFVLVDNSAQRFQITPSASFANVIIRVKEADFEKVNALFPSVNISETNEEPYEPYPDVADDKFTVWMRGLFSALLFFVASLQSTDLNVAIILITVLFIHELGHFIAMKFYHYTDVKIFFIPFLGAATSGRPVMATQRKEAVVLLAGPLPGIIAGLCLMHFADDADNKNVLYLAGKIFVILNMINLLPVFPLDGGKLVMNAFMRRANGIVTKSFYIFSIAAFIYFALHWEEYWLLFLTLPIFLLLFKKANDQAEAEAEPISPTIDSALMDMQFQDKLVLIIIWLACLYAPIYMGFPNFLF